MQYSTSILAGLALAAGSVMADGRPSNTSICDYYTGALLKNNTAANQYTVLTLIVNTVVIGNYAKPNISGVTFPDTKVPGILAKGDVNGTEVNLLPYFDGGLASSNRGGANGVSVNFLDGGAAAPLMMNKPANDDKSNQYFLLTHLYQFFGTLLGCSQQGMPGYSGYEGVKSMYQVHKFMDLSHAEVTYFIEQVGLSAESFGVAKEDIADVAKALDGAFNYRCEAPITLAPALGSQLQSICIREDCPIAANATCSMYAADIVPGVTNATLAMGEGNSSSPFTSTAANGGLPTATATGSSSGSSASSTGASTGGAAAVTGSGLLAGLAAFAYFL